MAFDLSRPWNWENGSLEPVQMEGARKTACGDPRRYCEAATAG